MGARGCAPPESKFFHFHAVFCKNSDTPPSGVGAPSGKSWIRHCLIYATISSKHRFCPLKIIIPIELTGMIKQIDLASVMNLGETRFSA